MARGKQMSSEKRSEALNALTTKADAVKSKVDEVVKQIETGLEAGKFDDAASAKKALKRAKAVSAALAKAVAA